MSQSPQSNRRQHERVLLSAMYTNVMVESKLHLPPKAGARTNGLCGHAYDISESGVRIELDEPLSIGQAVQLHLDLPGEGSNIQTAANVIWVNDSVDDPGPRRMALRFTGFSTTGDESRLKSYLSRGSQRVAA